MYTNHSRTRTRTRTHTRTIRFMLPHQAVVRMCSHNSHKIYHRSYTQITEQPTTPFPQPDHLIIIPVRLPFSLALSKCLNVYVCLQRSFTNEITTQTTNSVNIETIRHYYHHHIWLLWRTRQPASWLSILFISLSLCISLSLFHIFLTWVGPNSKHISKEIRQQAPAHWCVSNRSHFCLTINAKHNVRGEELTIPNAFIIFDLLFSISLANKRDGF